MRIGDVELASNLLLAPIAGYCDLGFRLAVRPLGGLGLAYTDLISARGLVEETGNTRRLVRTCAADRPLGVQLYGADSRVMADAARRAVDRGAVVIDINMGCPVDKVTRRNSGAAWLRDPPGAARLAEVVVKAVSVPVTVKIRLGPDENRIVAPRLATMVAAVGVAAVTVHGRTTAQRFGDRVNLDRIGEVVSAAGDMPVIGNGDVRTPQDAAAMIERTGCAGVMIGRGALRDPWLFRDTHTYLRTGRMPPPPSISERVALMVRHFDVLASTEGEHHACHMIRRRISWYAKKLAPCRRLKEQLRTVRSAADFHRYVDEFCACGESSGQVIRCLEGARPQKRETVQPEEVRASPPDTESSNRRRCYSSRPPKSPARIRK